MELQTIYLVFMCLSAVTLLDSLAAEYAILRRYRGWSFQHTQASRALRHFSEVGMAFWVGAAITALFQVKDFFLLGCQIAVSIAFLLLLRSFDSKPARRRQLAVILLGRSNRLQFVSYLTTVWLLPQSFTTATGVAWAVVTVTLLVSAAALIIAIIRSLQPLAELESLN